MANVQGLEPPPLLPFDPIEEELLGRPPSRPARAALLGGAVAFGLGLAGGTGAAFLIEWRSLSGPPSAPAGVPEPTPSAVPADAMPAALVQVEAPLAVDPARAPSEPVQVLEMTTPAAAATIEERPAQAAPVLLIEPASPARAAEAVPSMSTSLRDRLATIRSSIEATRRDPPRPEAR